MGLVLVGLGVLRCLVKFREGWDAEGIRQRCLLGVGVKLVEEWFDRLGIFEIHDMVEVPKIPKSLEGATNGSRQSATEIHWRIGVRQPTDSYALGQNDGLQHENQTTRG